MKSRDFSVEAAVVASQFNQERNYWLKKMAGDLQKCSFPYDRKKKSGQYDVRTVKFTITGELFSNLMALSNGVEQILHMALAAGVFALLYKYTGRTDIIVGVPIYKQEQEKDFINTVLSLRNQLENNTTFKELLTQVRETIIGANENLNYPIETLLYQLNMSPSQDDFPLFDVMVLLLNIHCRSYIGHIKTNMVFHFTRTTGHVEGVVEYNGCLYDKSTIERIAAHFKNFMEKAICNVNLKISEIEILSEKEKKQQLHDFNDNNYETGYPKGKTLHQLFEEQVGKTADNIAVIGRSQRAGNRELTITYRQLNVKANQLARAIIKKGIKPGNITGLILERSMEVLIGILAVLKTGGIYLPVDPEYPGQRIRYMIEDSNCQMILTQNHLLNREEYKGSVIDIDDEENYTMGKASPGMIKNSQNAAYVIYTSGSTGKPKGVLVEHFSVVNLIFSQKRYFNIDKKDRILQFSSICFDASVEQMFISLFSGSILVLIDNETLLHKDKFEKFISNLSITHIHAVPSFLNSINLEDSYNLRRIISGGDVCPVPLARKLSDYCDFYNEYGPTETTVTSIEMKIGDLDESLTRLPVGKPINNTTVYLFEKGMKFVPLGAAGELYIGGEGVARGYLNRPDLTFEKFIVNPFKAGERLYRTGDLARWMPDGNIEFLGRIDDQVKIRGFRIEPGEIEKHLLVHEDISEVVVTVVNSTAVNNVGPGSGDKYLAAYFVSPKDLSAVEIKQYLSTYVPHFMIPSFFMQIEKIPLTANGKIDRKALPPPVLNVEEEIRAPGNEIEKKLVEIWSAVLEMQKSSIGVDSNFFELLGHSLKATVMISSIHKELHVKIPLQEVFKNPTIKGLSGYIQGLTENKHTAIEPVEEKVYHALSSAQKRLYVMQQMNPDSISYNIHTGVVLEGKLHAEKLEKVFSKLLQRHESLRTSFEMIDGEPVQRIHDKVEFEIQTTGGKPDTHLSAGFVRPFDLSKAPLLRVLLIKPEEEKNILITEMHHITADGTSLGLLINDFMTLYGGGELPYLRLQYKDFSDWQNRLLKSEAMNKQEEYWLNQFRDDIPVLNLPTDYPRYSVRKPDEGDVISFTLDRQLTGDIKDTLKETGTTLFMFLLGAFTILLSRYSDQEDIVVGSPVTGRRHSDLENIIGMLINMLSIRNRPKGNKTFREFLEEVKENALNAYENQEYQFEKLVNQLGIQGGFDRNPLFCVVFTVVNVDLPEVTLPGLTLKPYALEKQTSKFDLRLAVDKVDQVIRMSLTYAAALFKKSTAERMANRFIKTLQQVLENKDIQLKDIETSHHLTAAKSGTNQYYQETFDF